MDKLILWFAFTFFVGIPAISQDKGGFIKGIVIDEDNQPLPYANIYIDQSTIGTTSLEDGSFILKAIPGRYILVVSFVGYETAKQSIEIKNQDTLETNFQISESGITTSDIEVKAKVGGKWRRNFARFKRLFLGNDQFSTQCKIENPFVLRFLDKEHFRVTCLEPIIIHNQALGYTIHYDLKYLVANGKSIQYEGSIQFFEMVSNKPRQLALWKNNRYTAYIGSIRHFLESIYRGVWLENGFILFQKLPNITDVYEKTDLKDALDRRIVKVEELLTRPSDKDGYKNLLLRTPLEIFIKHIDDKERSPYLDLPYAFSLMKPNKPLIEIHESGNLYDPLSITWFGHFSKERVARLLPVDYILD